MNPTSLDDDNIYSALFVSEHLDFVEIDNNNNFQQQQIILNVERRSRRRTGSQVTRSTEHRHVAKPVLLYEKDHNHYLRNHHTLNPDDRDT